MTDGSPSGEDAIGRARGGVPTHEERYYAFMRNSPEGVWRMDFDPPIDSALPTDTQVDLAYRHGRFTECNDAMARMCGLKRREDLEGRTLDFMLPSSDPAARAYLKAIIDAGYHVIDVESVERGADGRELHFLNTTTGVLEHGKLVRMWGTQRNVTDQRESAAAQAFLAAIVGSSDDAILSKNFDGIIQSCNAAAERMFGYPASELIGKSVRVLIPPELQAEEDEILARLRRGERLDHFETVRVTKDGRRIDISLTVSPVRDASGAIIGVSKVARDITERKRAAAALAAQQEWFRVTLGSIGDGVITMDPNGRVTFMNATAAALTGWTGETAIGREVDDVFRIVDEETRQPVQNPAALVLERGRIVGLANHTLLIGADGTERPIADSAAPIRDSNGQVIGVVLVFRDVTEARRAEDAVAEQREWFKTTLESIGDAVIATDVHGDVVFMNPIAEQLTGWSEDRAKERACTEVFTIVNEQTRRPVDNPVTRVLAEGTIVGLANHTVLIAADGTERPIDDSGAPIRNLSGHIIGVVLVFRDVAERRRAEVERLAATAERERLLDAERIARAEAERASRIKDDFVAMVSHELRTPLNAILGWAQLIVQRPDDQTLVERGLDVIARNTRLQTQLISDLLDISRIVSGKLQLDFQRVNLQSVITEAVETIDHEVAAKHLELHLDLGSEVGPLAGDPARLQQIVWNLLSNAIKFTNDGGRIEVHLRSRGSLAEVAVIDTGAGIRPEVLPHIFDRFHQADRSITRRYGGLGLGLSIVKHLVELHGGTVRADSAGEGQGASFTILLPTGRMDLLATRRSRAGTTGTDPNDPVEFNGLHVLVVEDEPDTRDFLKRLLETHGAHVVSASSAGEALAAFRRRQPDILISDIGLPDSDGYDLMQQIRREDADHGSRIPAIALTAYARPDDRTRSLRAGYQVHLAKPVETGELLATVASFARIIEAQRKPS